VVWRLEWPRDITRDLVSFTNPHGRLTNSDLEMAAQLLEFLALECLVDMQHVHAASWCDNTPTVSWMNKLNSSKSRVAARLIRALALRVMINASSPIISLSIAGTDNVMADVASRAFGPKNECTDMHQHADDEFLLMFNARFPLPQGGSWTMFQFPSKLTTLVISELRKGPLNLGSWL